MSFSILGAIKISLTSIGIWVTCSIEGKGSNSMLNSCRQSLKSRSWYRPTALSLDSESARTLVIPLICCTLTCLGIAVAFRPHVLHFHCQCVLWKLWVMAFDLNILWSRHFVRKRNAFAGHKGTRTFFCNCRPSTFTLT